ncbi:hypothetical protein M6D93_12280 [Jatrophihabitans telluris]|uniref:DUF222 domain-containing protein n=1 Tax=Jatrophihabitans telluris TaxID=2038343 RepID=A0ABY4QTT5_9ACTN|nr:hypothetical protein [Jatrophihabitans telluris]UQX87080.1 hypothetical protein M6D93_12280 [Jatrophihabitans telluris]
MAPPKEPDMTESISTTWSDERDAAFFGITTELAAGFDKDTALLASVLAGNDLTEQIERVLDDLLVAESWEPLALRSIARSAPHDRDLVAVPVTASRMTAVPDDPQRPSCDVVDQSRSVLP